MVAATLKKDIDEILPGVIADRRYLHEHPELAFEEYETAKFVAERLASLGVEDIRTGIGGTGVTGLIRGLGDGKVVLLRADMDALQILEANDVTYKSQSAGVMHACGHDAHTAMLLGAARILIARKNEFPGTVKLLFQPAEEVPPGGAIAMIKDGALEDPHVDAVFGLHVSSDIEAGTIAVHKPGPGSAASDRFLIKIQGKGGHAARPQAAIDTVVVAAQVITAMQSLVSRETDPTKSAVVSTTAVKAGEAFNVLPDVAELRGTIRTLDPDTRELMEKRLVELVEGVAAAHRAVADVQFIRGYPGIVNDAHATEVVRQAATLVVGEDHLIEAKLGLGGEDFAYFSLERPGCFFRAGTKNEERGIVWGHHHPRFDVEEEGFAAGIGTMVQTAIGFLSE